MMDSNPVRKNHLKRPSLFIIRGIMDNIDRSPEHKSRFDELARCTPELRNRGKMVQYLELLVNELGWVERIEVRRNTRWNPMKRTRARRWSVAYYGITQAGRSFLGLFPRPRVLPGDPTPEGPQDGGEIS